VFNYGNILEDVLIKDCGRHGRALEILTDYIDNIQKNPSDLSQFINKLVAIYPHAVPNESNSIAIIKSVIGNSYVTTFSLGEIRRPTRCAQPALFDSRFAICRKPIRGEDLKYRTYGFCVFARRTHTRLSLTFSYSTTTKFPALIAGQNQGMLHLTLRNSFSSSGN
jgi:hypothetical protein